MPIDLTPLYEKYRMDTFGEHQVVNKLPGVLTVQPTLSKNRVNLGDTVEWKRRPRPVRVTRSASPAIDEYPTVAASDPGETRSMTINNVIGGFGNVIFRGLGAGNVEYLNQPMIQEEIARQTRGAIIDCSNELLEQLVAGILPDVSLAVGSTTEELFQDTTDSSPNVGAPWQRNLVFHHAAKVLNEYGNPTGGRICMLSADQMVNYYGASFATDADKAGEMMANAARGGAGPSNTFGFAPLTQIYNTESTTVSTEASFGYATEAAAATATIAATPAIRDTSISITAGTGAPLDLKAGDVLYFTTKSQALAPNQRGRIQGYVVATDTAIPGDATVAVPITRSVRYNAQKRDSTPDVVAGLYLRGWRSHTVGWALHQDAIALVLIDPYASDIDASLGGTAQAAGPVLATGKIQDLPVSEGGTGLTFYMRITVGVEGWILEVSVWAGWEVVRPESVVRIVTPPIV